MLRQCRYVFLNQPSGKITKKQFGGRRQTFKVVNLPNCRKNQINKNLELG